VSPETGGLCVNEDSVRLLERPRCRVPLGTPADNGAEWADAAPLPAPACAFAGNKPVPPTEVRALADDRALYLRFDCGISDLHCLRPPSQHAPVDQCERVRVEISPENDFSEWFSFEADFRGGFQASGFRRMPGECSLEAVPDVWREPFAVAGEWRVFHGLADGSWWAEMEIPWATLGLKGRPAVIGFGYGRVHGEDADCPTLVSVDWTSREITARSVLDPGEALIGPAALAPERLELRRPCFGVNIGRVVLDAARPGGALSLSARTETADGVEIAAATVPLPEDCEAVEFEYTLDRSHSSHLDVFRPQRLVIEIVGGPAGPLLYRARLPMDRHLGICVDEPCGAGGSPSSATATRRGAVLDRITRALPRLSRATTQQGAPSDFCLCFADGSVAANLMADDAWEGLAAIIEGRFDRSEDRLVASMALVGQKSVANLVLGPMFFDAAGETSYHTPLHQWLGPLSILRYGGGPAVCRAAVLARLLQHVTNPATGRPFATRVVSLSAAGGPTRAPRCCELSKHLPAFGQQAGRVGAVAVDYGRGRTLLDPTGLVFFMKADGTLATVEEMLADEGLRREGAGRLAEVYGGVDAEEIARLPADRILSRGVFPEMCPNEAGPGGAFDPGMRYRPRVVMASRDRESEPLSGFVDELGGRGVRDGDVRVSHDEEGLRVCVRVKGADLGAADDRDLAMERVHLLVDPTLGHVSFRHFMVTAAGEQHAWRESYCAMQTLFKNLSTEAWQEKAVLAEVSWSARLDRRPDGYEVRFEIPWRMLDCDAAPGVIGLNIWLEGRTPHYEQVVLSPPRYRCPADAFSFATVYLNGSDVAVRSVDFGLPAWGDNTARVALMSRAEVDVLVTVRFEDHLAMRRRVRRSEKVTVLVPAGGSVEIDVPFHVDATEKMNSAGAWDPQRLVLVVAARDEEVFRGSWPMAYHVAPGVYQRYGGDVAPAVNPAPGDADFIEMKIRFICGRIPRFRRLTTRDGAAGDFLLRAEDGSVEFDLMRPGVLDAMGGYIEGLFDSDLDRILGMFYLAYHPAVARHMSGGYRIMEKAGPLSILRGNFAGGGGNCGYHSRAFAGMLSHLKINGEPLRAHTVTVKGHVITGFPWRGSVVLMDADAGHFFLTGDGRDLATIDDLRSGAPLLHTAGSGDFVRYLTFHDGAVRARRHVPDEDWLGVFPPGGPKA